jgi:hypothetical protein
VRVKNDTKRNFMKNIYTKTIVLVLGIFVFVYYIPSTSAHGVILSEAKDIGDYTVVMEVTSHYPAIYINDPVIYDFRIYEKGTEIEVPYDSSYIYLSKKSGSLIFQTETPAPRGVLPGSQITASVPDVGEYEIEVFFNRAEEGEVKTTFNFTSLASMGNDNMIVSTENIATSSSNDSTTTPINNDEKASAKIPFINILGGLALLVLGWFLGSFVKKFQMRDKV